MRNGEKGRHLGIPRERMRVGAPVADPGKPGACGRPLQNPTLHKPGQFQNKPEFDKPESKMRERLLRLGRICWRSKPHSIAGS